MFMGSLHSDMLSRYARLRGAKIQSTEGTLGKEIISGAYWYSRVIIRERDARNAIADKFKDSRRFHVTISYGIDHENISFVRRD